MSLHSARIGQLSFSMRICDKLVFRSSYLDYIDKSNAPAVQHHRQWRTIYVNEKEHFGYPPKKALLLRIIWLRGVEVYSIDIDLPALLQVLQKSRHNGRILAQIPYSFAGFSGGYAFIDMAQGRATACHLINTQKQIILSGSKAMDVTSSMGILHWTVGQEYQQTNKSLSNIQPQHTNPNLPDIRAYSPRTQNTNPNLPDIRAYSPPTQHTNPQLPAIRPSTPNNITRPLNYPFASFVPERLIHIDSALLGEIARRLRRVLVLVDGQRSVQKIASVLYPNEDGQQEVFSSLKQLAQMQIIVLREH
jgi:hypothetical protein